MKLNIKNETSFLKSVILGRPILGPKPNLNEAYDAKSYISIKNNIYPKQRFVKIEMVNLENILKKYDVKIFRPSTIKSCNQIFARDVAIIIEDCLINPNIIKERMAEKQGYKSIFNKIEYDKIYNLPPNSFIEGGDVVLYNDIIFVGVYNKNDFHKIKTARTNLNGFNFLKEIFPNKTLIPIELIKNDYNPYQGILHLDCAFMPVGKNKAILYKEGLANIQDYKRILDVFEEKNIFHVSQNEMFHMYPNIFSISPEVVISEESFVRLNMHLSEEWNIHVEKIPYREISKMGGLLRCSTLATERVN